MHHFLYPKSDTFISNDSEEILMNFGLDESLSISSVDKYYMKHIYCRETGSYGQTPYIYVKNYTGNLTGSLCGKSDVIIGSIYDCLFNVRYWTIDFSKIEGPDVIKPGD